LRVSYGDRSGIAEAFKVKEIKYVSWGEFAVQSSKSPTGVILPWDIRREALALRGGERWFVVRSLPRQELRAEIQLLNQGYRVFLPRAPKTVRHSRRLRTVQSAIFPSYMFVILELGRDRWRSINGTFGVSNLIMAGEVPKPVPLGVVEQLLVHVDERGLISFDEKLRVGQSVRVTSGVFVNAIGCLERLDASGRVRVLLDIMGGKVPARLDRASLEAA
jgi:transcription antitermination factor NusG